VRVEASIKRHSGENTLRFEPQIFGRLEPDNRPAAPGGGTDIRNNRQSRLIIDNKS